MLNQQGHERIRKLATYLSAIICLIAFGAFDVPAAPGDLDPTFGTGGKVTTTGETCGAPQTVYGRVTIDGRGARVAIDLAQDTMDVRRTQTNPFGYFRFLDVQPCLQHALVVRSKYAATFPIPRFMVHNEPVEVNIAGVRPWSE